MTRLSDSLRGLADRAPVDEVGVSTSAAMRRIYRGRRLRAAANATAGVGVAAVIALAAIHPGMGPGSSAADTAAIANTPEGAKVAGPGFDASGASELAWGQCGTRPFDVDNGDTGSGFSMALGEIADEVDSGSTVTATLTITVPTEADASGFNSTGPSYMVLWDGVVVGMTHDPTLDPEVQSLANGTATLNSPVDLVNCWDGTPLPGGAYELVAYQDFYPTADQPTPTLEPTLAPTEPTLAPTEPTLAPTEPTLAPVDPSTAPESPIAVDGGVGTGSSSESGATPGNTGIVGPAVDVAARSVSNTVNLVVAGDVPDDPFGAYLNPAVPAVVYPDDYLTPAAARDEYAARSTTSSWDMATGTQRVVKSGDSTTVDDQNAWLDSYYGCSADGTTVPSFPATSADWPLLKVEANLPGSVGVSYGWVVDGNPEVKVSVTNISGHTLPGFWGQPSTSIYLVKDGKVVATSYLASTDPNGNATSSATDGLLAPYGTLSGTYLWRDVNGCWIGNAQATITPGTYTVLMEQDLYLENGNAGGGPIMYSDSNTPGDAKSSVDGGVTGSGTAGVDTAGVDITGAGADSAENPAIGEESVAGSSSVAAPQRATADAPSLVAPAPGPGDGTYDWLSLQVWTSLGKVTIK